MRKGGYNQKEDEKRELNKQDGWRNAKIEEEEEDNIKDNTVVVMMKR